MYTINDLIAEEVEYDYRVYQRDGSVKYKKSKGLIWRTKDGKYESTIPDSGGYSRWAMRYEGYESMLCLGNSGKDYIFGIVGGEEKAIHCLNRLIDEYNSYKDNP